MNGEMYMLLQIILWFNITLVVYVYIGYPVLLIVLSYLKPYSYSSVNSTFAPSVSLLIPAYNEEKNISIKLDNCLKMEYPKNKLEIVVVSDGSTDRTNEIIAEYSLSGIRSIILNKRRGKCYAINYAVQQLKSEIIVISDADIICGNDSIVHIVNNFSKDEIGCVTAWTQYTNKDMNSLTRNNDLYHRYEIFIRKMESKLGVLGLGMSMTAFPKKLFQPIPVFLVDDTFIPLHILKMGYKVIYEPKIIIKALTFTDSRGEFKVRERNAVVDTSTLIFMKSLCNPFKYFMPSLMLISHKWGRWLVPFFLCIIFSINISILGEPIYDLLFMAQLLVYSLALLGFILYLTGIKSRYLTVLYYFFLVNISATIGFTKAIFGYRQTKWEPER